MKIRGQRECTDCGTRWSYYDTGSVACPSCESLKSVGVDERSLHTATAATLDLTDVRNTVDSESLRTTTERAVSRCQEFTRGYGFIAAGTLEPLDDVYLAAMELKYVAGELARRLEVADDEAAYFYELLHADDGVRPESSQVPDSLRAMRGLAYANAVRAYRGDLRTYLDEHPDRPAEATLERLTDRVRRVRALDGDVEPTEAERLVAAARETGQYLREGDETALTAAEDRLSRQS